MSLDFEGVGGLFFPIEHHLGEDLACSFVDLKVILALVARQVDNAVVYLRICFNPTNPN